MASQGGGSLGDRISKPETTSSWADEVNSPTAAEAATSQEKNENEGNIPQMDGAPEALQGSGLHEPDYAVEVKLADMQADPNNPLYSATTFEQLGL